MFNKISLLFQKNKYPNVILGSGIGDALGVSFETMKSDNPILKNWNGKDFLGSKYHKLAPGQFSDDTQMQCIVAQSLLDNNKFNPKDISERYIDWIFSGKARGYGKTTKIAIDNLKSGIHWTKSGVEGSLGNGSAMRAAPFGVFYAKKDFNNMFQTVKIDSAITHRSIDAEAGALAVAIAVYNIINKNESKIINYLAVHLPECEVKRKIMFAYDMVQLELKSVVEPKLNPKKSLQIIGTSANVRDTVPAAFYCFWRFDNFNDAIPAAIRAGGDTDTLAAIVGALFGAKTKLSDINKDWISKVEGSSYLRELDTKLSIDHL